MKALSKWFRRYYFKIVQSIAFFPALIALGFLTLVILMMEMDLRGLGVQLNDSVKWLRLKDADTARTVVATVAGGVISLTVFNFSIFMVVLNQAASQMSNRLLENMIGDRFQKLILGFYVGTIVYALFLLSNITDGENTTYIPSFSIYVLLLFTIIDIFLFIYFLHYITQSFRYAQLIQRIYVKTRHSMERVQKKQEDNVPGAVVKDTYEVLEPQSGYFQSISTEQLIDLATENDLVIRFLHPAGHYILAGTPFLEVSPGQAISDKLKEKLFLAIDFYRGQPIHVNYYYGFQHLMEVALKALSPGINDPVTAVLSLHALTDLFAQKLYLNHAPAIRDKEGWPRIILAERTLPDLFRETIFPIWHYGRKDQLVQKGLLRMISQLSYIDTDKELTPALQLLQKDITAQQQQATPAF